MTGEIGKCLLRAGDGAGGPTSVSAAAAEVGAGVVRADVLANDAAAGLALAFVFL